MIDVCKLVSSLIEMLRYCDVSPVLYRFAVPVSKFEVWSVQSILLLCLGAPEFPILYHANKILRCTIDRLLRVMKRVWIWPVFAV